DGTIDLDVGLTLSGEPRFGALLQLAQDERGDLRRRELAIAEADPDDRLALAADAEREMVRLMLHIAAALAHEPLDGVRRPLRVGQQPALGLVSDDDGSVFLYRHDRRYERLAARVADHRRHAVLDVGDKRVGSPEIDADDP